MDVPAGHLVRIVKAGCTLGEGPVWDERWQGLWWTDIQAARLYRWHWRAPEAEEAIALPERLGSFGLTDDPAWLVCAFESGFAFFHPESGRIEWIVRPDELGNGVRMNDGRIDRAGRFWAGSMVEDPSRTGNRAGTLYRLDPDLSLKRLRSGIAISNAIAFAPDGGSMWFTDTPSQMILRLALDEAGKPCAETEFAGLDGPRHPDGADCDALGHLWNAEWGGWRVTCYATDGAVCGRIDLPVAQPTSVTFGGPDFKHLLITSARENLGKEALTAQPHAGDLLICETDYTGVAAPRFAGSPPDKE